MTPVQSVKPLVEKHSIASTTRHVEVSVLGAEAHIEGNAFDITRVLQACQQKLEQIQANGDDPRKLQCVHVLPPQEDEQ